MAIIKMRQYKIYWSPDFRYDRIILKRYQALRKYLHANDHNEKNNKQNVKWQTVQSSTSTETSGKILHKSRTGIMSFNSGVSNCSENKKKWWCQAMQYQKISINGNPKIWSELVSLGLYVGTQRGCRKVRCRRVSSAVSKRNSKESKFSGIFRQMVFVCDKDLKANRCGSFDFWIDQTSSLPLIKWYDNKAVIFASTFSSTQATADKQRWVAKMTKHCKIKYPDMVKDCSQSMGGVDLNDMLISLSCADI